MIAPPLSNLMNALKSAVIEGGDPEPAPEKPKAEQGEYREIDIKAIVADPSWNSRSNAESDKSIDGLASTIFEQGLLNPITVTHSAAPIPSDLRVAQRRSPWPELQPMYQVIAGFRRLAACTKLGWTRIPAIIVKTDVEGARLKNLAENIARKNLRLYDQMRTMHELHTKMGISSKRLARDTGLTYQKTHRMVAFWPRLSPFLKDQWSKIDDSCWEPTMEQLRCWQMLSHAEQDRAWREWCNDAANVEGLDELELDSAPKRRTNRKRNVRVIKLAIDSLGQTEIEEAQRRALLWAIGRRESF